MTLLVGTYGPRSTALLLVLLEAENGGLCDLIEVRLDFLPEAAARVKQIVKASPKPVMATCRRAGEGGAFTGGERARLDLLARAADAGAAWVNVEDDVPLAEVRRLADRGAKIVRSLHVPTLPEDADAVVARLLEPPADAAKLVPLRATPTDVVRLLDLVGRHRDRLAAHVSDLPFSRYAGAAMGSFFTYASLRPGGLIPAPIPTVWEMLERSRVGRLRNGAKPFLFLGAVVEGSVSPDVLNWAFEELDTPIVALRWSCDDPLPAIFAIQQFGWAGAAITTPHKERVFALLRDAGARFGREAEETGAVSMVLRDEHGLVGHDTDVRGILDAVKPFRGTAGIAGRPALVLGAGGVARAAVRAAIEVGCGPVVVHARRPEAAEELVALRRDGEPEILVARSAEDAAAVAPALVVQATPAGATGEAPVFDFASLPMRALVQEMVVSPGRTANHEAALAAGHRVSDGLHVLIHQAREQVRHLAGREPGYVTTRNAGMRALGRRGRTIVLIGLRCSGKTEVGSRLARLLGLAFVNTDREVEFRTGRSPDEMIGAGEELALRAAERSVLRDVLCRHGVVVAMGDGAALHSRILRDMRFERPTVFLEADNETLLERMAVARRAPLTLDELRRQRVERVSVYKRVCWVEVNTTGATVNDVAEILADYDDGDWTGLTHVSWRSL